ncbi:flippase [Prosthecobacter sp.]|uniref:flippase n=1 Tax=Prosthecobacter sp. TaxID=1965333 RepID=UPI0037833C03
MAAGALIVKTLSLATGLRMVRLMLSFALGCVLARHLGGGGFGQLAVAMAVVSILLSVGELGFARYTVREMMQPGNEESAVLGTTITARFIVSALLFAGLLAWVALARPEGALLIIVYSLQLLTNPVSEMLGWFEVHGRVSTTLLVQFAAFLVSAACIAAGIWQEMPLWFFALTYVLEGWIIIGVCGCIFWRNGGRVRPGAFRVQRAWAMVARSWPELASQGALMLLFRLDTLMIEWMRGPEEAGVYSAAVRVSEMAYFMPGILSLLFLPALVRARQEDAARFEAGAVTYFSASILLSFLVASFLLILSPGMPLAFGAEFARSGEMLRVHAWAFIPYAVGVARTQILTVEDRLAANLPSVIAAVAVNVLLNLLWIPAHGGVGAAWATLVSYTVAWVAWTYLSPWLRRNLSGFMTRAFVGLPRFTWLRMRSWLHA